MSANAPYVSFQKSNSSAIAEKIIAERQRKGDYKSLVDVKQRTGLPLSTYRHIV